MGGRKSEGDGEERYTPGADYIIHHSQSIVANMSFYTP